MNIDERLEAPTQSIELLTHDVDGLRETAKQDGENIRLLARVAGIEGERGGE
jgi:hypothetical protein